MGVAHISSETIPLKPIFSQIRLIELDESPENFRSAHRKFIDDRVGLRSERSIIDPVEVLEKVERLEKTIRQQACQIEQLKAENTKLWTELDETATHAQLECAADRRRITTLEQQNALMIGSVDKGRIDMVFDSLKKHPRHMAYYWELRQLLQIKPNQLSALLKKIEHNYPDMIERRNSKNNPKEKYIVLKPILISN